MAKSLIANMDGSVGLKKAAPIRKKALNGFRPPPSHPVPPLPVKRRGPIIAGGIIRMDLGGPRNDRC
jgi:hypothetical protein